jgi:hypothetical protein
MEAIQHPGWSATGQNRTFALQVRESFFNHFQNAVNGEAMSISLIVERNDGVSRTEITFAEWEHLVVADCGLRMSAQPVQARNPHTGELLSIARGQRASEFRLGEKWIPFLEWRRGTLRCRYSEEMEAPENSIRIKIADLSRKLHASIFVDVQDEPLQW